MSNPGSFSSLRTYVSIRTKYVTAKYFRQKASCNVVVLQIRKGSVFPWPVCYRNQIASDFVVSLELNMRTWGRIMYKCFGNISQLETRPGLWLVDSLSQPIRGQVSNWLMYRIDLCFQLTYASKTLAHDPAHTSKIWVRYLLGVPYRREDSREQRIKIMAINC